MTASITARRFRLHEIVRVGTHYVEERVRGMEAVVLDDALVDVRGAPCYATWVYALDELYCFHEDDLEGTGRLERRQEVPGHHPLQRES